MKIQCENCGVEHELEPPSWVVSSGRVFRFRCSSCGHSQSVQPPATGIEATDEVLKQLGAPLAPTPVPPSRSSTPQSPLTAPAPPLHLSPQPASDPPANPTDDAVFLKQNGQIYMVSSWETLKSWIRENRVDKHDLVSQGGVKWEPVGSRSDLAHLFGGTVAPTEDQPTPPIAETPALPAPSLPPPSPSPFPFGGETPFATAGDTSGAWHDDDTEGIPMGLPPLPTEDRSATGFANPVDDIAPAVTPPKPTPPPVPSMPDAPVSASPAPLPALAEYEEGPEDSEDPLDEITPPPMELPPTIDTEATQPGVPSPIDASMLPTEQATPGAADDMPRELSEEFFRDPSEEWPAPRQPSRSSLMFIGAAAFLGLCAIIAIAWALWQPPEAPKPAPTTTLGEVLPKRTEPAEVQPRDDGQADAQPEDGEEADAGENPDGEDPDGAENPDAAEEGTTNDEGTQDAEAAPEPTKEPTEKNPAPAKPAPKPAGGASTSSLNNQGWNNVESNPTKAASLFRQALSQSPGNTEATYGLGYALILSGNKDGGRAEMCKAFRKADSVTKVEISSILSQHNLSDCK